MRPQYTKNSISMPISVLTHTKKNQNIGRVAKNERFSEVVEKEKKKRLLWELIPLLSGQFAEAVTHGRNQKCVHKKWIQRRRRNGSI